MKNKPLVPLMLRIEEDLRKKIEQAAGRNGKSMNSEINDRLWNSFSTTTNIPSTPMAAIKMIKSIVSRFQ